MNTMITPSDSYQTLTQAARLDHGEVPSHLPNDIESFENLLDEIRPEAKVVEVIWQYHGKNRETAKLTGALIYTDEILRYALEMSKARSLRHFYQVVEDRKELCKNTPRLWPGCRHAVAHYLGVEPDQAFHDWFDQFANPDEG